MKYIKAFESIDKYKEGDYIIIKPFGSEHLTNLSEKWNMYPFKCAQIVEISGEAFYMETFDVKTNKYLIFWLLDEDIERKATEEEIIYFEAKRNSNKFNR